MQANQNVIARLDDPSRPFTTRLLQSTSFNRPYWLSFFIAPSRSVPRLSVAHTLRMWCDNCLLVFPLRGGALALAALIFVYSVAGGVVLFMYGNFLYFGWENIESCIYGGVAMAVAALALLSILALSNNSYMLSRLVFYITPLVLLVCAIRAGILVYRLDYYQSNIIWECNNGGQCELFRLRAPRACHRAQD